MAVRSVRLRVLNGERARAVMQRLVDGRGTSIEEVGCEEKLWGDGRMRLRMDGSDWKIIFAGVDQLLKAMGLQRRERSWSEQDGILKALFEVFEQEEYVLWMDSASKECIILLKERAGGETQLQAIWHVTMALRRKGEVTDRQDPEAMLKTIKATVPTSQTEWKEKLAMLKEQGWKLAETNIDGAGRRLLVHQE